METTFDFDNFDKEAEKYISYQLNLWALKTDWSNPTIEDVKNLQEKVSNSDKDILSGFIPSLEYVDLEDFENAKITKKYIQKNIEMITELGNTVKEFLLAGEEPLAIDIERTLVLTHTAGGPGCETYISVNRYGEPVRGETIFEWGNQSYKKTLTPRECEAVFAAYDHLVPEISDNDNDGQHM